MTDKVVIFTGSKRDFDVFLESQIGEYEDCRMYYQILQTLSRLIMILGLFLFRTRPAVL